MALQNLAIDYNSFSSDEKMDYVERASMLAENDMLEEAENMLKQVPLSPLMVNYLQFLHGDDYIEKEGYKIKEKDNA